MKSNILFDFDGTLVDTSEDITRAAQYMLRRMNGPELPKAQVMRYVGRGLRPFIEDCLQRTDEETIQGGENFYREYYSQHLLDHAILYPGVLEVLEYFRAKKQRVVTNKPHPFASRILNGLGISQYFIEVLGGDSGFPRKPDPTVIQSVIQKEKAIPDDVVMIGDSVIDVQVGKNSGVWTVAVSHGFTSEDELKSASPDILCRDFPELLKIVQDKGW